MGAVVLRQSGRAGVRTPARPYGAATICRVDAAGECAISYSTATARRCNSLYIAPEASIPPAECCVLPAAGARELILRFASLPVEYDQAGAPGRLVAVLLDAGLPRAAFGLPLPRPTLADICAALEAQPDDARTLADWAGVVGASERTLARRFVQETGLGFGWRQRRIITVVGCPVSRGQRHRWRWRMTLHPRLLRRFCSAFFARLVAASASPDASARVAHKKFGA